MVGSLELLSTPLPSPSASKVTKLLLDTIHLLGGVNVALLQNLGKEKRAAVEELRERVRLAASLSSPADWPPCLAALEALDKGDATPGGINTVEQMVEPWLALTGSLKGLDFLVMIEGALTTDQLRLLN